MMEGAATDSLFTVIVVRSTTLLSFSLSPQRERKSIGNFFLVCISTTNKSKSILSN